MPSYSLRTSAGALNQRIDGALLAHEVTYQVERGPIARVAPGARLQLIIDRRLAAPMLCNAVVFSW
jgi:hypothetical protein